MSWTQRDDENDPATLRAVIADWYKAWQVEHERAERAEARIREGVLLSKDAFVLLKQSAEEAEERAERAQAAYCEQLDGTRMVDDLRMREIKELNAALARVQKLHPSEHTDQPWGGQCRHCVNGYWPCDTVKALEGGEDE